MEATQNLRPHESCALVRPVALVTGASGGIGLDLARLLAADGHDLILVARSSGKLEEIAHELAAQHAVQCEVIAADLARSDGIKKVMSAVEEKGLAVDILVNNAGVGAYGEFAKTDLEADLRMIQLNVATLTALAKRVMPAMIARGHGRILNVGSTGSFQAAPLMAVYAATKAYVLSFSEAIANELRGTGVTVTALCPGPTDTGFVAAAKMESSGLFKKVGSMASQEVARIGYRALKTGKPVVVPGFMNRVGALFAQLGPRRQVVAFTRWLMERT